AKETPPEIEVDRGTPPTPATPATPASPSRVPSGIGLSRTDSIASDPAGPVSPRGVAFSRTDSIVSVSSNHRVARLREREAGDTPNVRTRDSSPNRNIRFAAELSRPASRSGIESANPYATQRASSTDLEYSSLKLALPGMNQALNDFNQSWPVDFSM
ncbi:4301_t:CDS:2, partial [Acaulospora colombiana]